MRIAGIKRLLFAWLLLAGSCVYGQKTEYPLIGAQVFIEPGQSPAEIKRLIQILHLNNMKVCRIRMFEDHIRQADGTWDYSRMDAAFDEAARLGIKVFATLFPSCDFYDLGGYKFPSTQEQMKSTSEYIKNMVTHYKDHPALYAWVLQNEPGTGKLTVPEGEWPAHMYEEWQKNYRPEDPAYFKGPYRSDFREAGFVRYLTDWYLRWLHDEITKYDDRHFYHVNPHQLFENLPEYDFPKMEEYLTSLGASMHMSWHFDNFRRSQYPLGVAVMSDIIRNSAGKNPFWITELQGGNVTFSGRTPLCPTREEIAHWLWTGVASGAQGAIFWTLNPRSSGIEAGEWGMVDYQGNPTDRLTAASLVAKAIMDNKGFFAGAVPLVSDIALVYNTESFIVGNVQQSPFATSAEVGRTNTAMSKSLIASYEALSAWGISPDVVAADAYDWERAGAAGKAVVLPDVIALSSSQWQGIEAFVRNGGKLIVTGMTGYYDQNNHCVMLKDFPLRSVLGAELSEYKYVSDQFGVRLDEPVKVDMVANMWRGIIRPDGAKVLGRHGGEAIATSNAYGKGEAVWIPSPVGVGAYVAGDVMPLTELYGAVFVKEIEAVPVRFARPQKDVLLKTMRSGDSFLTVVINKGREKKHVGLVVPHGKVPSQVFGVEGGKGGKVTLRPEECAVYIWK